MTELAMRSRASPSAAGGMLTAKPSWQVRLGPILFVDPGTSSARPSRGALAPEQHAAVQTSAGSAVAIADHAGAAIGELRRLSGLSWDQLAHLFKVSRRALHFWASGKAMAPSNEEHLQRLLSRIRQIDRGSASANRTALLAAQNGGEIPLDLLAQGQYDRAVALLGPGQLRPVHAPRLSATAAAARAPRPPEELVGALQDRVHPTSGRLLAAKAVRINRSK